MHVEEILREQSGNPIIVNGAKSKPDLYFENDCGELVSFDWKTLGRSALRSIAEQRKYQGALGIKYPGHQIVTMQSVSWIDYVRPLLVPLGKTFPDYPYR